MLFIPRISEFGMNSYPIRREAHFVFASEVIEIRPDAAYEEEGSCRIIS